MAGIGNAIKQVTLRLGLQDDGLEEGMKRVASGTTAAGKSVEGLNQSLTSLRGTMGSVVSQLGMGPLGNIIGAAGLTGLTVSVAAIIGQAIRMAYVFQETSARVAANLSIGTAASIPGAMGSLQSAALGGVPKYYGYTPQQALNTMSAYGTAAGATYNQARGSLGASMMFARATGLQPEEAAGALGDVARITGESSGRVNRALYGGAEGGGQLGRDIRAYISTTQSMLQMLALGSPGTRQSISQAAGYVNDIAAAGGIYTTPGMIGRLASGMSGLTQGNATDPQRLAIALRAGISPRDIILGENRPEIQAKMARTIMSMGSGPNTLQTAVLMSSMMGQDAAKAFLDMKPGARAKWLDDAEHGRGAALSTDEDKKVNDLMKSSVMDIQKKVADIDTHLVKQGDKLIAQFDELLKKYPKLLEYADVGIDNLPKILGSLIALDVIMALGKGGPIGAILGSGAAGLLGGSAMGILALLGITAAAGAGLTAAGKGKPNTGPFAYDPEAMGEGGMGGDPSQGPVLLNGKAGYPVLRAIWANEDASGGPWTFTGKGDARTNPNAHPRGSNALGYFQFLSTTAQDNTPAWFKHAYREPSNPTGSLIDSQGNWRVGTKAWNAWIYDVGNVQEATAIQHAAGLMAYYNKQVARGAYGPHAVANNVKAVFAGWLQDDPGINAYFQGHPDAALKSYVDAEYASYLKYATGYDSSKPGGATFDPMAKLKPSAHHLSKTVAVPGVKDTRIHVGMDVYLTPVQGPGPTRTNSVNQKR